MTRDQAIEKASAFITKDGYGHGKCLASEISPRYEKETWVVEFAYVGLEGRALTKDPPSMLIAVESESEEVTLLTVM